LVVSYPDQFLDISIGVGDGLGMGEALGMEAVLEDGYAGALEGEQAASTTPSSRASVLTKQSFRIVSGIDTPFSPHPRSAS
jgi:hypothetical protein